MRWPPPPPSRNGSRAGSWGRWRRALRFRACIRPMPRTRRATRRASPETPMKLDSNAKGVYVIAPTPFDPDGRIDESSIDRMTDFFLKAGVSGMTVLGQLGEAPKMEHNESVEIVKRVVARANVPVVVGVSAPGFAAMRALTGDVMALGAAGVMIAPPNTLRTDDSIVQYYKQASDAIGADVPFVIQDYPLTFSVQMTPGVIRRIVMENPACQVLKHEDWPGLDKISALRGFERDGSMRHLSILTGNNALFLDFEMERGADGANPRHPASRTPRRRGARPCALA